MDHHYLAPLLFHRRKTARCFLGRVLGFIGEHPVFGAAGAFAFLSADFFNLRAFGRYKAILLRFNLVQQQSPRDETVESLLARGLTLDLQARRTVKQHHAGGSLVDVLATMPAGADERFFDVRFAHAESSHALQKPGFFIQADGKRAHGRSVARIWENSNEQLA